MARNSLIKLSQTLTTQMTEDELKTRIYDILTEFEVIYSYLVRAKKRNGTLTGWLIEYNICENDTYNTLKREDVITELSSKLSSIKSTKKSIVLYKQPCIEIMLKLYRPLMKKLAIEQANKWSIIEYEDAFSICQLMMLKLYNKGYYIHKHLLKKCFENEILLQLRHDRNKPEIYSLEKVIYKDGDNGSLTIADMLPDRDAELKAALKEDREVFNAIFEEVKEMLIEYLGERQFAQLLRDYGEKHTTSWSTKKMQLIKQRFKRQGIDWNYFTKGDI